MSRSYIVGIDLGTTNTSVAYAKRGPESEKPQISLFAIKQLLKDGSFDSSNLLPSFLYFPLEEEKKALGISKDIVVGEFAQKRAAELPERAISSSKSWLCHRALSTVETKLPLGSEDVQISPVDCAVEILKAIQEDWDRAFPDQPLSSQEVYVTVPASFAPEARSFVQSAIETVGLKAALIEEPQAALYAWLWDHEESWKSRIEVGDSLLVVDIGGGTTDFSLVVAQEEGKELTFSRVAVGPHLLLGGDNIDHALAVLLINKFSEKSITVDEWQERMLIALSRTAKEDLLNSDKQKTEIVLPGRGSKLIAKSQRTELFRKEIESVCLDGFFPHVSCEEQPQKYSMSALKQQGLEYANDPRITAHIASFLKSTSKMPKVVLFNGGTMKAESFQKRILENLHTWAQEIGQPVPQLLLGADLDFAVSKGAVAYGLTKQGFGVRIKSNLAASYFVGIEESRPAIPGVMPALSALCVAPYGTEEGSSYDVPGQTLSLMIGRPVQLKFFTASEPLLPDGREPQAGMVVRRPAALQELHPIETTLEAGPQDQEMVDVRLVSEVDELGTLRLSCKAPDGRSWKFEFHTRVK